MALPDDPQRLAAAEGAGPYHLRQPTLTDARAALQRLYGSGADGIWTTLLAHAGLTGHETDQASFDRLVQSMAAADPVTRLCSRGLAIRSAAFTHLSAAHALVRNAQ